MSKTTVGSLYGNWRKRAAISITEAAAVLGISRGTAYQQAREGLLPTARLSQRRLVVPVLALESMLDRLSHGSNK